MERLQKRIASSGYTSRRKAEELILAGRVRVNDEIINTLGYKVSDKDKVYIDDELLGKDNKVYYLLNKPRGVVCTTDDDKNRTIITSLIDTDVRIFPVGRLDYDTTGAIILTNDGEFANLLTSPSSNVLKTYVAKIKGALTPDKLFRLRDGVVIDGIKTKKAKVKVERNDNKLIATVKVDYSKLDLITFISDQPEFNNYVQDGKFLVSGAIKIYESYGAICDNNSI